MQLKAYWFDYGTNDFYAWIPRGNAHYSKLLTAHGIPHKAIEHNGDHVNHTRESIAKYLMPLCDSLLVFDKSGLGSLNKETIEQSVKK